MSQAKVDQFTDFRERILRNRRRHLKRIDTAKTYDGRVAAKALARAYGNMLKMLERTA